MENRKKLHDYGLAIIFVGILNLFMVGATFIAPMVNGTVTKELALVEPDLLGAVKVVLNIVMVLMLLPAVADILLGIKALKVSKTPKADKGYIIVAVVFLVMSAIAIIFHINGLSSGNVPAVEVILNTASSALSVCIYALFIKAANAVRKDVLGEKIQ